MKKWVCTVCGYVYEGENPPEKCPQCGVPASKFIKILKKNRIEDEGRKKVRKTRRTLVKQKTTKRGND